MRALVTGGSGFIGTHVVRELVGRGWDVRVLDARTPSEPSPDAEHVLADLRDEDAVRRAVRDVDAVTHQAAMVGLGVRFDDVVDYVQHNDVGTAVLLRALAASGFAGRFVLAGSMVVYGEGRYRCSNHGLVRPGPRPTARLADGWFEPPCPECGRDLTPEPIPEDAPTDPRNVYAATKLHQEHLCAVFGRETGVPVSILRYHNVFGPGMPRGTPYAGVASVFLSQLEAGRRPQVFEDGCQLRDFIHVREVARANALALEAGPEIAGVFNVATGRPRTVGDMAAALSGAFGPAAPAPEVTRAFRLGDVRHVFASAHRARDVLGFQASDSFDEGVRELLRTRT